MEQPINILLTFANECVSECICQRMCVYIQRYVCYKSSVLYSLPILWSGVWVIYAWTYGMEELAPLSYTSLVSKALFLQRILVSIYQSLRHHSCRTTPWHHQLHWLPGHSKITDFCLLCHSPLILEILFGNWSGAWIWGNQCQMLHMVLQSL